ncbi:methylamine utilization protein MauE [Streptomyces tendae]|uniref:MauE/DoxX family redox-associated membrane protein n=1 Tax=Streptomyces tendae TaxID=1932 RepID=UPI001673B95C|nr:MauE/DoxX family redox-associated membrane protein [Streptomyces tendae]GHA82261.1 methylamine utilization protein MauE [Streptomyces tendae]
MNYVIVSSQVLLVLVFLCSVTGKLRSPTAYRAFRLSVAQLAPPLRRRTKAAAPLVIAAEAAVAVALVVPASVAVGFAGAACLLVGFALALAGVLRREEHAACHCFGGSEPVAPRHVVRNVLLVCVALTGLVGRSLTEAAAGSSAGLLLAAGVGVLLALFTVVLDDLAHLFGPVDAEEARA